MNKYSMVRKHMPAQSLRFKLLLMVIVLVNLDQLTKWIARHTLEVYQIKTFIPFWDWTLVYNQGAAFSFLADQGGWQRWFFVAISSAVSIGLIYYLLVRVYSLLGGIAFALILSGALGNLIDRALYGRVTDFIFWHVDKHYWPAFNLADSCVSVGVVLLIIENILYTKGSQKNI